MRVWADEECINIKRVQCINIKRVQCISINTHAPSGIPGFDGSDSSHGGGVPGDVRASTDTSSYAHGADPEPARGRQEGGESDAARHPGGLCRPQGGRQTRQGDPVPQFPPYCAWPRPAQEPGGQETTQH